MNTNVIQKNIRLPYLAICLMVIIKALFFLTHHIQEDAFITWRVAQNLLDYGVIGFNGTEKISASTTHLYVFVSYLFNLIFGKSGFIYPLLLFNSLLFTTGSYFLSKLFLKDPRQQAIFIVLFGLLPPAIKISILGMEYGLLFFLETGLLYWGFFRGKNWAQILFPILILFTRIDTVIFLSIIFLSYLLYEKEIRWRFVSGCVLGVLVAVSFNWFYFHEFINNTIVAKKLAYGHEFSFQQKWQMFLMNYGNFWGMLKLPGDVNYYTILILLTELAAFIYLIRKRNERHIYLIIIFAFGWAKQTVFLSQRSYFDWYYWVPQLLLFVPVLLFVLQKEKPGFYFALLLITIVAPMLVFQTVHSIATGNGEWNYRRKIGLFLDSYEKDKSQWIFLEPAGYIPYFSHLKAIDEVGLVDKQVQQEIRKDRADFWINTVKDRKPKYLLTDRNLYESKDSSYYKSNYSKLKFFRIGDNLHSSNKLLNRIYALKPSGRDYVLYQKKNSQ